MYYHINMQCYIEFIIERCFPKTVRIGTFHVPPRWLFVRVESDDGSVGWGEASLEGHAEAVDGARDALGDRFLSLRQFYHINQFK